MNTTVPQNSTVAYFDRSSGGYELSTRANESGEVFERPVVVARRSHQPDWLQERLRRIDRLRELEPNWDSYGAKRIDLPSIDLANQLLKSLSKIEGVECPTVTASPDGNVGLCWDSGERSLDVEVLPSGKFAYAYLNENAPAMDREGVTTSADHLILLLTQW